MLALADQVEKGTIDAALQPKIDRIVARPREGATRRQRRARACARDPRPRPAQRVRGRPGVEVQGSATAASASAASRSRRRGRDEERRSAERRAQGGPMAGMHCHEAARRGPEAHRRPEEPDHRAEERGRRSTFKAQMRDEDGRGHEPEKVLDSFRSDKFDATAAPPRRRRSCARACHRPAALRRREGLPILTPEQRKLAADKLRTMANHSPARRCRGTEVVPRRRAISPRSGPSRTARPAGAAPLAAAWEICKKDVRIERRTGEIVATAGVFFDVIGFLASMAFHVNDKTNAATAAPARSGSRSSSPRRSRSGGVAARARRVGPHRAARRADPARVDLPGQGARDLRDDRDHRDPGRARLSLFQIDFSSGVG